MTRFIIIEFDCYVFLIIIIINEHKSRLGPKGHKVRGERGEEPGELERRLSKHKQK